MSAMQSPNGRGGEHCPIGRSTRLDWVRVSSVPLRDKRGFAALEGQCATENPADIKIRAGIEFFVGVVLGMRHTALLGALYKSEPSLPTAGAS
jgi:hypothetical protein